MLANPTNQVLLIPISQIRKPRHKEGTELAGGRARMGIQDKRRGARVAGEERWGQGHSSRWLGTERPWGILLTVWERAGLALAPEKNDLIRLTGSSRTEFYCTAGRSKLWVHLLTLSCSMLGTVFMGPLRFSESLSLVVLGAERGLPSLASIPLPRPFRLA